MIYYNDLPLDDEILKALGELNIDYVFQSIQANLFFGTCFGISYTIFLTDLFFRAKWLNYNGMRWNV